MKYCVIPLILLGLTSQVSAQNFYDQLCDFNFNWKKYGSYVADIESKEFSSDKELIQAHLTEVLNILNSNPIDHLSSAQLSLRKRLLLKLKHYKEAGKFPVNYYVETRTPVFIDLYGTHCAVGFLIKESGHEDLAQRIATYYNYDWVKDINDSGLLEWQKSSGFTIEELKIIQGAYDFYLPNARFLPNRFEIPQKPEVILAYFDDKKYGKSAENLWCKGEGRNGVIHGRWIQFSEPGKKWIVGHYHYGKRSGMWEEYYHGTNKLCRTEHWRDDKLNGVRKRWDREGRLIEEILFKDDQAILKTNYDLDRSLIYERTPLDSNIISTKVYTSDWLMIASGKEQIHNPGNLLWFQNIELTALNSASIKSREMEEFVSNNSGYAYTGSLSKSSDFYAEPSLVNYKKIGEWRFYPELILAEAKSKGSVKNLNLSGEYIHYGNQWINSLYKYEAFDTDISYDSVKVLYNNDYVQEFIGFSNTNYRHYVVEYHKPRIDFQRYISDYYEYQTQNFEPLVVMKTVGEYNLNGERIGRWAHYNALGQLIKTEAYIIPWKETERSLVSFNR